VGSLALEPVRGLPPPELARIGLLFLVGFGMKAGLMPLHFWLPGAHANAPSHVSAVMSGVVLKMGVYGLMRMASLLPELPASAGGMLLTLGAGGAVVGAALAVAQADLKRLLAYSSVDNMAIVIMALGLALVGRATGRDALVVLGVAGAVWHVWNHALFKSLLFFAAGSVLHATGTRRLDRLGGLARSMPLTTASALVGSLALAGLPPLNGFFSELVVYVGLARSSTDAAWPALAAPALALTGALAVVAMVKVYGGAFLGEARHPANPHDPPAAMRVTMVALALGCAGVALGAFALGPVLDRVVAAFTLRPMPALGSLVPLGAVSALTLGGGAVALGLARWTRPGRGQPLPAPVGTWDCGYALPSPRIQYTPTSFAELATGLFGAVVGSVATKPSLRAVLPAATAFSTEEHDPVLDRAARPTLRVTGRSLTWLRLTQQGKVQAYVLYVVVALLVLLWIA
jgi:formate hydrogenlyase subunit 3/multisubunit Na+/H+ antiporter MnhD subunit